MTRTATAHQQDRAANVAHQRDVVLVYTNSTWADGHHRGMCRGPDRLYQTLAGDNRVGRLLVANPFRSLPALAARRILHGAGPRFPSTETQSLAQPYRLRRRDPHGQAALERAYGSYDRTLARAVRRAGLVRPSVIALNPLAAAFCAFAWAERVVLYLNDDWAALDQYRRWWPAIEEAYERFASSGRPLCAVTQALLDRVAPRGPARLMPNGVEPTEWRALGAPPSWFAALPAPRALYLGTVDSRLDIPAVAATTRVLDGGTLVLAGPVGSGLNVDALRTLTNVHLQPAIPRAEVAATVGAADVCVLPHAQTRLTAAMSPLKIYEYLAGGRPVVATDLEPVRDISPRVLLVDRGDDFGEAVSDALRLAPQAEAERLAFVEATSWRRRHETLLDLAIG